MSVRPDASAFLFRLKSFGLIFYLINLKKTVSFS